jgi:hypothetical protein
MAGRGTVHQNGVTQEYDLRQPENRL